MDQAKYKLSKKLNRYGYIDITWSEKQEDGTYRSRTKSTGLAERAQAQKYLEGFVRGEELAAVREGEPPIGELLTRYLASANARGVARSQSVCVRTLSRHLSHYTVPDLDDQVFLAYREKRTGEGAGAGTIRRELGGALRSALRWADRQHLTRARLPVIELPKDGNPRPDWLIEADETLLFATAAAHTGRGGRLSRAGRFVCLGLDTGQRKEAIETLTWDRVDMANYAIDFVDPTRPPTKKRRARTVITDRLMVVLQRAWRERKPGCMFVLDNDANITEAYDRLIGSLPIKPVTPHILRHTCITLLLRSGVSVFDVSKMIGVSVRTIEATYGHHVVDKRLRELANRRHQFAAQDESERMQP